MLTAASILRLADRRSKTLSLDTGSTAADARSFWIRTIQVKHLKAWTFRGMLTTDVLDRAIPWTELILRNSEMPRDLNLSISQRISVALAFVLTGIAIVSSVMNATVFLAPLIGLLFLMSAQYEVELTMTRRFKGTVATTLLIVSSGWPHSGLISLSSL